MSIATIESQKITKSDLEPYYRVDDITIAPEYALAMCRYAYIAGRTAGPTGAEIRAVITEWDRHSYYSVGDLIVCMCGARFTDRHGYRVHLVRAMLDAARKAVSE